MKDKSKKLQKKRKKKANSAKKQIQSTLDWLEIEKINEYYIDLRAGKKHEVMLGIKLEPHSLFLDNQNEQNQHIHLLRSSLNRIRFPIYHGFVFNPINLDTHIATLVRQMEYEQDMVIRDMLQDDIDKDCMFIQSYRELEFFMMIKGKPGKKMDEQNHQLQQAIKNAGFVYKPLNRLDFENFMAYEFENDLVNDFYYSRGVFDLNEEVAYEQDEEDEDDDGD